MRTPPPTISGRCGRCSGRGRSSKPLISVIATAEGDWTFLKQALENRHRLAHPLNASRGGVEGKAGAIVLGLIPAGANTYLEPSIAQLIEGGEFLGKNRGMPKVVVEDKHAETELAGDCGRQSERREGRELADQVVGEQYGGVAQALDLLRRLDECLARQNAGNARAEAKRFSRV